MYEYFSPSTTEKRLIRRSSQRWGERIKTKLNKLRCKNLTDSEKSLETATIILCNHPNTSS
jgi:hypothetical protein